MGNTNRKEHKFWYNAINVNNIRALSKRQISLEIINKHDKNGKTLLHAAVRGCNVDITKLLIDRGANVNEADSFSRSPLHDAMVYGNEDIVKLLIERGANVNTNNAFHRSPLHHAITRGNKGISKLLIESGANVSGDVCARSQLHDAVTRHNPGISKLLIDREADINAEDDGHQIPLHEVSCNAGIRRKVRLDMARLLIDSGENVNGCNKLGESPLHLAIQRDRPDIVKLLIDREADINAEDGVHQTPLHEVICNAEIGRKGRLDMTRLLIDGGANVNACNKRGESPLHLAIQCDRPDVLKLLMDRGANIHAYDVSGLTILHTAIIFDRPGIVMLLIDAGANIYFRTVSSQSPLYLAMRNERLNIINCLLYKNFTGGFSSISATQDPLKEAIRVGRFDIVMLLTDRGTDICLTSSYAKSLLHESIEYNQLDIVRFLIDCGVDADAEDVDGKTPLEHGIMHDKLDIVSYLIDGGACVYKRCSNGKLPLDYAMQYGSLEAAKLLIHRGVDVNLKDLKDSTKRYALHKAIEYDSLDLVRLLIDKGAHINARDRHAATPLHYAVRHMPTARMQFTRRHDVMKVGTTRKSPPYDTMPHDTTAVIGFLISSNADVNAKDNDFLSPFRVVLYGVKNGTIDEGVLLPFLKCQHLCESDRVAIYRFLPELLRRGYGIDSKIEVTMIAKRLIADGRYRDVLYLISAGLYPDYKIFEDCLKQNLENISRSDMKAITECVSKLTEVRSLQITCRDKIRHMIWDVSSAFNIIPAIQRMTMIPEKIQQFLLCDEHYTIWKLNEFNRD